MQTRRWLGGVLISAGILSALVRAEESAPAVQMEFVDPDAAEIRDIRRAGEYAIDRLVVTIISDASHAVAEHKEVEALAKFHLKDVPVKNGTVAGLPRITAMKLTSLKLRNPQNAPDPAEKETLDTMQGLLMTGQAPGLLVQKVARPDAPVEWRVYKPLANIRQCGTCHGDVEAMSSELRQAIQTKYPDDKAVGFALNEWRGIIRVTVGPASPPGAPAGKSAAVPKSSGH